VAVLLLHAWVFDALVPSPPPIDQDASSSPRVAAPALRLVTALPARAPPAAAADTVKGNDERAVASVLPDPKPDKMVWQPLAPVVPPPEFAPTAMPLQAAPRRLEPLADGLGADSAESPAPADPVPLYATRLPAPVELHYVAQRGAAIGSARLLWRRDGDGYELALDAALPGQPLLGSSSRGQVNADGVAPSRHVERRKLREVRAANFRRDAGLISFSGPSEVLPLPPGAQDRLSWMIQLPAIVQADPSLADAGATVTLFVVGTRGDAQAWAFEARERESIELPAGPAAQLPYFVREPTRPFDTRVEVWLDPQREHLPVRARLTTVPGGQSLELRLAPPEVAAGLN
jgi:hypothetical protein